MPEIDRELARAQRWIVRPLLNFALVAFALAFVLLLAEGALRLFPGLLPQGAYGSSRFDPELRTNVYGSTAIYNKGRLVVREPNSGGFLDVEHQPLKPAGVVRVGFFGDSYVESLQVPLEQVFYRLLPETIGGKAIEPFGFGISGWGTVHSYLASQAKAPKYDLDVLVYVFVENDLGDSAFSIQRVHDGTRTPKTFAELSEKRPGFRYRWTRPPDEVSTTFRVAKAFQTHFLLGRLLWHRTALLLQRGVAMRANEQDRAMAGSDAIGGVPNQNDLVSTWPPQYVAEVEELGRRILRAWNADAQADGREFFVLYVPRGEEQLRGVITPADTWLPWLQRTCEELEIPLLNPIEALRTRLESGEAVYDDHWTPVGHEVIANQLSSHLGALLSGR